MSAKKTIRVEGILHGIEAAEHNTDLIQKAIDAVKEHPDGGVVQLPPGKFYFNGPFTWGTRRHWSVLGSKRQN